MISKLSVLLSIFILSASTGLQASDELNYQGKHIVVFYEGMDFVHGTQIFLTYNKTDQPIQARIPFLLPKEAVDWQLGHGAKKEEVEIGEDGRVYVNRLFKPGDNLITFGFKVPARFGKANLTFNPGYNFSKLQLMIPHNKINFHSYGQSFQLKKGIEFWEKPYDMIERRAVLEGSQINISLKGIPEGRSRFWLIGGVFLVLLIISSSYLVIRSNS